MNEIEPFEVSVPVLAEMRENGENFFVAWILQYNYGVKMGEGLRASSWERKERIVLAWLM